MSTSNDVLVIVINVNAAAWKQLETTLLTTSQLNSTISNVGSHVAAGLRKPQVLSIRFEPCWKAILDFVALLAIGWNRVKVALIGVHSTNSALLWESQSEESRPNTLKVTSILASFLESDIDVQPDYSMLTLGLSQALCIINAKRDYIANKLKIQPQYKIKETESSVHGYQVTDASRIILIDLGNSDHAHQYSGLLNLAFAAQKRNIVIDVCTIGVESAAVCHQLAQISGGFHLSFVQCITDQIRKERAKGIQQTFFRQLEHGIDEATVVGRMFGNFLDFHFTIPPPLRETMPIARQRHSARSAACRCHNKIIEIAAVCSCCLSIFCNDFKEPMCLVCKVRFKRERDATVASVKLATPTVEATTPAPSQSSSDIATESSSFL